MMSSWLIDTNVLIYSFDKTCPLYGDSFSLMRRIFSGQLPAIVAQQNLLEFLAVVTNARRVKNPVPLNDAMQKVAIYAASFSLIAPTTQTLFTFSGLLAKHPESRHRLFDVYLMATALDNGINQICTWNVKDFKDIDEVNVKTPLEILGIVQK